MKNKKLLVASACVSMFLGVSCVGATPANPSFTDDGFYKCVVDSYNKEKKTNYQYTDNIPNTDLANLTRISCNSDDGYNISDPKGLEILTNLKFLRLNSVGLDSIDLSNNTKLVYLNLERNYLDEIDITHNPELEDLYLSANKFKSIDLSNNINLLSIDLSGGNELENINLSSNTKLRGLNLNSNDLEEIDLSNNIELEWLELGENQLESINLSNNTKLEYLYLANNQLTNIDLFNNVNLDHLSLKNNPIIGSISLNNLDDSVVLNDFIALSNYFKIEVEIEDTNIAEYVPADNEIVAKGYGTTKGILKLSGDVDGCIIEGYSCVTNEFEFTIDVSNKNQNTKNPNTGVYSVSGGILIIAIGGYVVVRKKNLFKKI